MKRSLLLCAIVAAGLGRAVAQDIVPVEPLVAPPAAPAAAATVDETPDLWLVELASPPTADGTSLATVRNEKAAFRAAAKKAGLRYTERFAYDRLFNGLSVRIARSQLAKLAGLAGVKNVWPAETIRIPETSPVNDPDLFTAIQMTGASIAQNELGYTGAGVKVGIIDTGIDYDHPDLGGDGNPRNNSPNFPNSRVVTGWDFVGDDFNADSSAASFDLTLVPDKYPDDCAGHGTHVAGIVGASPAGEVGPNGSVRGVAPGVSFGAYRVFGCEGSTTSDVMIAAMEQALADGMDVVNMSIGSAFQWPQYPTAQAATRLVNRGVVVVASIGNSGTSGLWAAGAPGLGEKVIGVASYDNTHTVLPTFTVSPDGYRVGYVQATAAPVAPTTGTFPLGKTGTPTTADDACNGLPAGSLAGQIALVRRGTCGFYNKALAAQQAGAAGVVLYNNAPGYLTPTVAPVAPLTTPITIPVVFVSSTDGAVMDARIAAGAATLTWTDLVGSAPQATGNLISSFSSYGLSPDLDLKPDLGAPGGAIWSTYPLELGGYANLSGTSMSSPHVAGTVALLLEAKPRTPAQAVRGILQNTAVPKPWQGAPTLGYLDQVSRQGAGMVQIDRAILATTKVTPAKLALGESQAGPATRTLTIENAAAAPVTYVLSRVNALSVSNTFTPSAATSNANVAISPSAVTVPAHGKTSVTVTITPPTGPDKAQYGGYIVLTPQGGGQVYRVPFAGFVGDYQSITVLAPTKNEFPWLTVLYQGNYYKITGPTDWEYTLQGDDMPWFVVHFDHPSRSMRINISDTAGKDWHTAYAEDYLPRNSTSTGIYAFPFDGTTYAGNRAWTVPNGVYVAKISVLKALGDASNPADWETWTSPAFTIARP